MIGETELPRRIEHTLLAQEADASAIARLCEEARQFGFAGVCVNPVWVRPAKEQLKGAGVLVVSVAGFPMGATRTDIKVAEAAGAAEDGADEIDMVVNVGWLVGRDTDSVLAEIRKVRRNLPTEVKLKVILEVNKLTVDQVKAGVECIVAGGAQFAKTATGMFGSATVEQVQSLVRLSAGRIEVKAAGGIRTLAEAKAMIFAGASRIGSSASVRIMAELLAVKGG